MRLLFAIETKKAIVLLSGDYGTGKTLVCEAVISQLPGEKYKAAFVTNPRLGSVDLVREIAYQLGEEVPEPSMYDAVRAINALLDKHAASGRHCVAIIDESQLVSSVETFEDLRLLLNHHQQGGYLLTLVLVGQGEIYNTLKACPQLMQRVGLKYHIPPLQPGEIGEYIAHRLRIAGGRTDLFDSSVLETIAQQSQCNPREINAICDLALLAGVLAGSSRIGAAEVQEALKER